MLLPLIVACTEYRIEAEPKAAIPDIQVRVAPVAAKVCPDSVVDVEIGNEGDATLSVAAVDAVGDGWTVADAAPFPIEPGASVILPVTGSGGTVTVQIRSDDPDEPLIAFPIASEANRPPSVVILSPFDETSLPTEGDVALTALVADDDDPLADLGLEWVSTLTGVIATATAGSDGSVSTLWPESERSAGPQWVSLFATDPCGERTEDIAWICQDGPFVVYPIVEEGWHFEGTASRADDRLIIGDGSPGIGSAAFDLASTYDGDDTEVQFDFRIAGAGGEGLSLTFLDADRRVGYIGGSGCGVGFGEGDACTEGPGLPGWSLVLDTLDDAIDCAPGPHLAFHFDGALAAPAACAPVPPVEDGAWHRIHLRLVDQQLSVTLDDESVLSAKLDGDTSFQGVVGFTAAARDAAVAPEVEGFAVTDFHCAW